MQSWKRLRVANHARVLIATTYEFTRTLPREEQFGLSSQMRRAALSVGLNIVEGTSRATTKEFIRFLDVARGSAVELEFALTVSEDLSLGSEAIRIRAASEVQSSLKQLSKLITALRRRLAERTRT